MARLMPILIEFPVGNEVISVGSLRDTYGYYSLSLFNFNTTGFRSCFCCYWREQVTILACSVYVIWRLLSPSSCLSVCSSNNYRTIVLITFIFLCMRYYCRPIIHYRQHYQHGSCALSETDSDTLTAVGWQSVQFHAWDFLFHNYLSYEWCWS
jgi:hypothetical protein